MKLLYKILKEIKHSLRLFVVGVLLYTIISFFYQYLTVYVQKIIDDIITPVFNGLPFNMEKLIYSITIYGILVITTNFLIYISRIIISISVNNTIENIRNKMFDKLQKLPISYFDDKPAGKISTRIINNTETLRKNFYEIFSLQFSSVVNTIIIYIIIFSYDYKMGIILLSIIPVTIIWQRFYSKFTKNPIDKYYKYEGEINGMVNEVINNSTNIQVYSYENVVLNDFNKASSNMYNSQMQWLKLDMALNWILVAAIRKIFQAILLFVIGYQILKGNLNISVGIIFLYIDYIEKLFSSIGIMIRHFPNIQRSLSTGKNIFEILEENEEENSEKILDIEDGDVEFDNVSFSYVENVPVLKNISFKVKKGQTVAIVGHTGSGKSSIMNLLFRFYDPQNGTILIDNKNIKEYNRESVRDKMGIVLQDPYLFTGDIASNISMGNEEITDEIVKDSLIKVGGKEMIEKLSNGIKEKVVEKGNTYSSGEKQLISFARALASNPKILILDEATSHIDTETETIIQNAMEVVKKGRTTFIIAHRLSTIQNADMIIVLEKGEIKEKGVHQELIDKQGIYYQMYKAQQNIKK